MPMKKAHIIVQAKDDNGALEKLRDIGLLHIEHQQAPAGKDISAINDDLDLLESAINILSDREFQNGAPVPREEKTAGWRDISRHIIDSAKRLDHLREYSAKLEQDIFRWQAWGEFDPQELHELEQKGIYVRLYQVPQKELGNFPADSAVKKIFTAKGMVNCVVVFKQKPQVPFREIPLPKMGLSKMRARLSEDRQVAEFIKEDIKKHTAYFKGLLKAKSGLEKELEFFRALRGMGEAASLKYICGYIPFDAADTLHKEAAMHGWGVVINEPSEDDLVPTLLRNPRWVSIINPIFKLIEVVPGYHELDISLWFLIFFSIFFGMLIGDAGYGAILFVITFLIQRKLGRRLPNASAFILFYILSSCAIIWGLLSATFFGQEWLPSFVKPILPALRDDVRVQSFCFLLGALQLSIAHLWRFILKLPSLAAWADMGWLLIIWAAFLLAKHLVLGFGFPVFGKWLIMTGALLVLFFSHPNKNPLKGVGQGLGTLLLNLMNNFTDLVSYIRLFAVGLATVAVADAFNKMALSIGFNNIFSGIATALILLLGHTLNVLLGPMSVLVHGVRLNVLEFCNHLDIKWSGFSYRPLKN